MSMMNRLGNAGNRFQGKTKKVLCVCSAGLLRSPTMAHVLSSDPWNFNTRAAGMSKEYALVPVDLVLATWADEIVVVESWMQEQLRVDYPDLSAPIHVVQLTDSFEYRDPALVKLLKEHLPKLYPLDE